MATSPATEASRENILPGNVVPKRKNVAAAARRRWKPYSGSSAQEAVHWMSTSLVYTKPADCHDVVRLSEGHEFAHQGFCIVGVPVLGAEPPGQLVLKGSRPDLVFSDPGPGLGRAGHRDRSCLPSR